MPRPRASGSFAASVVGRYVVSRCIADLVRFADVDVIPDVAANSHDTKSLAPA